MDLLRNFWRIVWGCCFFGDCIWWLFVWRVSLWIWCDCFVVVVWGMLLDLLCMLWWLLKYKIRRKWLLFLLMLFVGSILFFLNVLNRVIVSIIFIYNVMCSINDKYMYFVICRYNVIDIYLVFLRKRLKEY